MARPRTVVPPDYEGKRVGARQLFDALPRGSQMEAAFDLRLPPITVSRTLNGRATRPDVLDRLLNWARNHEGPTGEGRGGPGGKE